MPYQEFLYQSTRDQVSRYIPTVLLSKLYLDDDFCELSTLPKTHELTPLDDNCYLFFEADDMKLGIQIKTPNKPEQRLVIYGYCQRSNLLYLTADLQNTTDLENFKRLRFSGLTCQNTKSRPMPLIFS